MRPPTRDVLTVIASGQPTPGLGIYGLRAPGQPPIDLPTAVWPTMSNSSSFALHGEPWEVPLWEIALERWPSQTDFDQALDRTFDVLLGGGCVVAWVGTDLFADPPHLFDPELMSGGVLVARTATKRYGRLLLDKPVAPLDDSTLEELRQAAGGLANAA